MKVLDLFSGIGGFSLGLERAGFVFEAHYFSEIDKHASAIYKYQNPDAIDLGSVEYVRGSGIERPNIITFGSPCQDFSIAGKRAGMDGERSSLVTHAIELIAQFRPDFFIWENVKGTFSSNNGADFWAIIKAFADIGGYRLEWQLLNTAWFLPQNRERIYLVGTLGNGSGRPIFPLRENLTRINERTKQTEIAASIAGSGNSGGMHSSMNLVQPTNLQGNSVVNTIRSGGRGSLSLKHDWDTVVVPVLTPDRHEKRQNGRRFKEPGDPAFTLTAQDKHGVMIQQKGRGFNKGGEKEICPTISTSAFEHNNHVITELPDKYRVHRNDEKKSEIQGASVFKEHAKRMDIIDNHPKNIIQGQQIRRLTEIECERLQGFEDDYTKYGNYDGEIKKVSATQRYKCLGNAVTVDVVENVGKAIMELEKCQK